MIVDVVYIDDGTAAENCLCDAAVAAAEVAGYDMSGGGFYFDGDFECDIE